MTSIGTENPAAPWRRGLRAAGRLTVTLAVIGGAVGAGMAGYGALSARASVDGGPPAAPATTVVLDVLRMETAMRVPRTFTGQFEPPQEVMLAFEDGGTIREIAVREGAFVAAGGIIARLDTRLLEAERARLQASRDVLAAQLELARRTDARQQGLFADGHVAQARVDETSLAMAQRTAALSEVDAALTAIEVRLSKAVIRAPFAGRIGARVLDAGAVAGPGAPVATMLEDGPARFRVALDPDLAEALVPGDEVSITVGSVHHAARLSSLAPELDPATRARVAWFDLSPGLPAPPARSTGEVVLSETRAATGAWVPVAALRPGPRGSWTLLTVAGDTGLVRTEAAEILRLDGDRAFVRGSFADGTRFIPEGTHRVVPGEVVRVAEAG